MQKNRNSTEHTAACREAHSSHRMIFRTTASESELSGDDSRILFNMLWQSLTCFATNAELAIWPSQGRKAFLYCPGLPCMSKRKTPPKRVTRLATAPGLRRLID